MKKLFSGEAKSPQNAIVVVFDLEGFSLFFNQPDVQLYIGAFLNKLFSELSVVVDGGRFSFSDKSTTESWNPLEVRLVHQKFLGDGALWVFLPPKGKFDFAKRDILALSNQLWNFKNGFRDFLKKCHDDIPVADLPKNIRFGVARGTIYELKTTNGVREYIGFCLNLASRLQKYCPNLGYIASARLGMDNKDLEESGYIKVIATKLRGFPREIVVVDKTEFGNLSEEIQTTLFEQL